MVKKNVKNNVCCFLQKYRTGQNPQARGTEKTITANWYNTKCFPEILQEVNVQRLMLHHNNASSHTTRLTVKFLEQKHIKVIEDSPYSRDIALCDF